MEKSLLDTVPEWLRNLRITVELPNENQLFDSWEHSINDLAYAGDEGATTGSILFVGGEKYQIERIDTIISYTPDKATRMLYREKEIFLGVQITYVVGKQD